jgi:RimJ/RimL family protein N-acetyltransferase
MIQPVHLENDQILLRPILEQDFSLLLAQTQDKALWEYFTYDLSTLVGIRDWAQPAMNGERLQFVVVDKKSGVLMGSTAFGNYSARDQRIEIGWTWLGKDFHGKGINRQMKYLMLSHTFEKLGMQRVEIKTDVLNIPARRAVEKMGFVEEGVLRSHTLLSTGRRRNTIYYSVLAEEWELLKKNDPKRSHF